MGKHFTPELLAPAGSLAKLKTALRYGADAVYCAGQEFGLRAAADNFTPWELAEGVAFAHARGAKVYVVLNGFLHDADLARLPEFIALLKDLAVDAVIVSDPGVALLVRKHGPLPLHVSTQASVLNLQGVLAWKELGATRVVLGREVTIADAGALQRQSGVEMELFVHGAMCMAYSGHCVISNFTQGRDSNRGGCAHSCRFNYELEFEAAQKATGTFMSSKDLAGLAALPKFVQEGICSLKVEGRMKGPLYAATTTRVYREALDFWRERGSFDGARWERWLLELKKLHHRDATTASLLAPADASSIFDERDASPEAWALAGVVLANTPDAGMILECRYGFTPGARVEVLRAGADFAEVSTAELKGADGRPLAKSKPSSLLRLPHVAGVSAGDVARVAL